MLDEDCYEVDTPDWVMVSCLNGRTAFRLKNKEFIIDGGECIGIIIKTLIKTSLKHSKIK